MAKPITTERTPHASEFVILDEYGAGTMEHIIHPTYGPCMRMTVRWDTPDGGNLEMRWHMDASEMVAAVNAAIRASHARYEWVGPPAYDDSYAEGGEE